MVTNTPFAVDTAGLKEILGEQPLWRHSVELATNVFDEFNGYSERAKPTTCKVTVERDSKGRSSWIQVEDDGAGFEKIEDVFTFFGTTSKRSTATVSGRFNSGEKQLLALAREWTVETAGKIIKFDGSKRNSRTSEITGTKIRANIICTRDEETEIIDGFRGLIAPKGLSYIVNDKEVERVFYDYFTNVTLPTVILNGGSMSRTARRTGVEVYESDNPKLYELGIPICDIGKGFRYSLNILQKVPVSMNRDNVPASFMDIAIGRSLESLTLDGHVLLSEDDEGSEFTKGAFNKIKDADALSILTKQLFGDEVVRWSSSPEANLLAERQGFTILPRNTFSKEVNKKLDATNTAPSSLEVFRSDIDRVQVSDGSTVSSVFTNVKSVCPNCGHDLSE